MSWHAKYRRNEDSDPRNKLARGAADCGMMACDI